LLRTGEWGSVSVEIFTVSKPNVGDSPPRLLFVFPGVGIK